VIRSIITLVILVLAGMFVYHFVTGRGDAEQRARHAANQVSDTVKDQGMAGAIRVRLTTAFGMEATRFLHVYHDSGKTVVYGLVPESLTADKLMEEARKVSGVTEVAVAVQLFPELLAPQEPAVAP
jgi:osmotically-inducible protein OsmY